jgi:hypothetical protein
MASPRFAPGNPGGPGRPKGARNKLGEVFLEGMITAFNEPGADGKPLGVVAIQRARDEDPSSFCRTLASILPKELTGEDGKPLTIQVVTGVTRSDET